MALGGRKRSLSAARGRSVTCLQRRAQQDEECGLSHSSRRKRTTGLEPATPGLGSQSGRRRSLPVKSHEAAFSLAPTRSRPTPFAWLSEARSDVWGTNGHGGASRRLV